MEDREDDGVPDGRDAPRKRLLRAIAAQAAAISAAVHLLWAWPRLLDPPDARPYLFVLAAALAVGIAVATLRAGEYRRLYALGAGTLGAFLGGYLAWHGGGTGEALAADPLAIVAVVGETVGVVAFLALYRLAPPTSVVLERHRTDPDGDDEGRDDRAGRTGNARNDDGGEP
ncbi:hypothetical protein GJ633_07190 [Halorubrum sp. CBA1125]|uniref:hypothetical protein n=1 Tax=Halorubrum sp. CBA1125 TaxID=2668072 RepID=UPI00135DD86C|nr:hypothetical protein [Halorubrum sp. CBA1125]MUW14479.1 hypothetical protein [Halorubrum sp. CBA1125]